MDEIQRHSLSPEMHVPALNGRWVLYSEHLTDKTAALAAQAAEHEMDLRRERLTASRLVESNRERISELHSQHAQELAAQADEHKRLLSIECDRRGSVVCAIEKQHDIELAAQAEEHREKLAFQRAKYEQLVMARIQQVDGIRASHSRELGRLKSQHAKELAEARAVDCETCGGTGEVDQRIGGIPTSAIVPCPDCAEARGEGETALVKRYRKKPIEVEAVQYTGNNGFSIERWSQRAVIGTPVLEPTEANPTGSYLQIKTLEGVMTAIVGDWIIKGVQGEFYPCKPDIFEETYSDA